MLGYAPGSPERASLEATLKRMAGETVDMPLVIGGREVRTGTLDWRACRTITAMCSARRTLPAPKEIAAAIEAAQKAWPDWSRRPWAERAAVFLKAADLLAGEWRPVLNAATMLGQSKTAHQAEIDSAAELIDFLRFNVEFMLRLYAEQPVSALRRYGISVDYRPLEGFVYAVTPFNFTAIAGNLPERAGADGQHRGVEAVRHGASTARTTSCSCCRRRACRRASSTSSTAIRR